jgi:heat shock protein HslJ
MKKIIYPLFCMLSMAACNNTKKTVSSAAGQQEQTKENAALSALQQSGTDFLAEGSSPVNWRLEMNYDDTIRFSADDGLSLKVAYNKLKKDTTAAESNFTANISSGNVVIRVTDETCTIPTHREVYNKGVSFTFNGKVYTGCGKFLADQTLDNKWVLDKIGVTAIYPKDYNRIPEMQFDLAKQQVSGNDGCNSIGGKIEVQGNRIKFGTLISTKMTCKKNNIENILSTQVSSKLVNYYFKNGELYLYLPDDNLLVFKKA